VFENNNLLQGGIGRKCLQSKVGRNPTAQVLVFFTQHVMKIMLTKYLLTKWVGHGLKSVGLGIDENLTREFCVSNEDYEVA
jgi:hypothetical protein